MDKLSERLEAEAAAWESWNRDFPEDQSPLTPALLREAAALAKRYEDAPVAELYHTRHERNQYYGELYAENLPDGWEPAFTAIADGQRVRIVLDKEG